MLCGDCPLAGRARSHPVRIAKTRVGVRITSNVRLSRHTAESYVWRPVSGVIMHRLWIIGAAALLLIAPVPILAQGQAVPSPPALAPVDVTTPSYDSAYYAWQAGNYPEALQRFERLLNG